MESNTYRTSQCILNIILFTLIYTCNACPTGQESVTRIVSKNYTIPKGSRTMYLPWGNETHNDAFFYADCQRLDSEFLSCNITMETWPFAHGTFISYCENYKFSLPRKKDELTIDDSVIISRLKNDSRIVLFAYLFTEDGNKIVSRHYIHIINVSNCTKIANVTIAAESVRNLPILFTEQYQNSFEFVVQNKKYCNGESLCKITYDFEGRQVGDTVPFKIEHFRNMQNKLHVSLQDSSKGYYIIENNRDEIDITHGLPYCISYIDSSGQRKRKISNSIATYRDSVYNSYDHSVSHGNFVQCFGKDKYDYNTTEPSTIYCAKYDTQEMRMNFTLKLRNAVHWLSVRDLSDGGFILVTGGCTWKTSDYDSCKKFRIQRFAADGQMYKALEIDEPDLPFNFKYETNMIQTIISENDSDEFCIFWTVQDEYIYYTKWCVSTKYTLVRD